MRLTNTAATRLRSSALPVSFSTMEASVTSCSGVLHRHVGGAAFPYLAERCASAPPACAGSPGRAACRAGTCRSPAATCPRAAISLIEPVKMSLSSSRATICSDVRPSGIVTECCTTLPSTMVLDDVAQACVLLKRHIRPDFSSERAFSANTAPMNTQRLLSITPSRSRMSAMSLVPARGGMLTILSCASGPGASSRCLP